MNQNNKPSDKPKTSTQDGQPLIFSFNADAKATKNWEKRMAKKPHVYERKKERAKKYGYE